MLEQVYASQNLPPPPPWRNPAETANTASTASTVHTGDRGAPVGSDEVLYVAVQLAEAAAWVEATSLGSGQAVISAAKEAAAESVVGVASAVSAWLKHEMQLLAYGCGCECGAGTVLVTSR